MALADYGSDLEVVPKTFVSTTARWNLLNKKEKLIRHEQFVALTTRFKELAEEMFGTPSTIDIRVMDRTKEYTTFADDDHQAHLDKVNAAHTTLKTSVITDVTPDLWNKARYIEASIRPIDKTQAPQSAFAHIEFRGSAPDMATFYIQGNENSSAVMAAMIAENKEMLAGNGRASNGKNSAFVPAFGSGDYSSRLGEVLFSKEKLRAIKANTLYQKPDPATPQKKSLWKWLFG